MSSLQLSIYTDRATRQVDYLLQIDEITPLQHTKLLNEVVRNTLLPIYRGIDFSKREISILVQGYIQNDGMGDFYHMVHAAKVIQAAFPEAKIIFAGEVLFLSKRIERLPALPFETILWGIRDKAGCRVAYEDNIRDRQIKDECEALSEQVTVILELPHERYENSITSSATIPKSRIFEYGTLSDEFYASMNKPYSRYGMGVAPLEVGIIWKEPQSPMDAIETLSNPGLRSILLNTSDSTRNYMQTHILHFAYMRYHHSLFVQLCLAADENDVRRAIDFILNDISQTIVDDIISSPFAANIQEIQTIENGAITSSIRLGAEGKTVRLINPFPLENTDMQKLIAIASGCVGCTGDLSISEVLSHGKVPLYYAPIHKKPFIDSLKELAVEFSGNTDSLLVRYLQGVDDFKLTEEKICERGRLLQNPDLYQEMAQFCAFLKEHYDFNRVLVDLVKRNIALAFHPEVKELENDVCRQFQAGKSLPECYAEFEVKIRSLLGS